MLKDEAAHLNKQLKALIALRIKVKTSGSGKLKIGTFTMFVETSGDKTEKYTLHP